MRSYANSSENNLMTYIQKSVTLWVLAIVLGLGLSFRMPSQTSTSKRPALVLICNASKETNWVKSAKTLQEHFEILIVDTEEHSTTAAIHDTVRNSIQGEYRVSSTTSAQATANQYTSHYKSETKQFVLPDNSEDLLQISQFFHHFSNTQQSHEQ